MIKFLVPALLSLIVGCAGEAGTPALTFCPATPELDGALVVSLPPDATIDCEAHDAVRVAFMGGGCTPAPGGTGDVCVSPDPTTGVPAPLADRVSVALAAWLARRQ